MVGPFFIFTYRWLVDKKYKMWYRAKAVDSYDIRYLLNILKI